MSTKMGPIAIISDGFSLFFKSYFHTLVFILPLIAAFLMIGFYPDLILHSGLEGEEPEFSGLALIVTLAIALLNLVVTIWVINTLHNEVNSIPVTFQSANRKLMSTMLTFIALFLIFFAIGLVVGLGMAGMMALAGIQSSGVSTGPQTVGAVADDVHQQLSLLQSGLGVMGVLAFFIVMYFAVRLYFLGIAIIIENNGPISAIKRSFELTKGRFWKTFLVILISALLLAAINILIGVISGVVASNVESVRIVGFVTFLATILIAYGTYALVPAIGVTYYNKILTSTGQPQSGEDDLELE